MKPDLELLCEQWEALAADRFLLSQQAADPFFRGKWWGESQRLTQSAAELRALIERQRAA